MSCSCQEKKEVKYNKVLEVKRKPSMQITYKIEQIKNHAPISVFRITSNDLKSVRKGMAVINIILCL